MSFAPQKTVAKTVPQALLETVGRGDVRLSAGRNNADEILTRDELVRRSSAAARTLREHGVEAGTEEIILVVETKTGDETERARLISSIKREIVRQAGVRVDRVELAPSGFVEKNTSGKIQRARCREKILNQQI